MAVSLADFTSVIELGAGIILASGIAQALFKSSADSISDLIDDIYRLKDSLPLTEEKEGRIDSELQSLEMDFIKKKASVREVTTAMLGGNFLGLLIPATVLYMAPLSGDVGLFLITILVVVTLGWGPFWAAVSFSYVGTQMQPMLQRAKAIKSALITGN